MSTTQIQPRNSFEYASEALVAENVPLARVKGASAFDRMQRASHVMFFENAVCIYFALFFFMMFSAIVTASGYPEFFIFSFISFVVVIVLFVTWSAITSVYQKLFFDDYLSERDVVKESIQDDLAITAYAIGMSHPDRRISRPDRREMNRLRFNEDMSTKDFNRLFNSRNISKLGRQPGSELVVQLYGSTKIGCHEFPFPVYCSKRTFMNFLEMVEQHPDRRILFMHGKLTWRMYRDFRSVWMNLPLACFIDHSKFDDDLLESRNRRQRCDKCRNVFSNVIASISMFFLYSCMLLSRPLIPVCVPVKFWYHYLSYPFYQVWVNLTLYGSSSGTLYGLVSVINEETFKPLLGWMINNQFAGHWAFALMEWTVRGHPADWVIGLLPLCMHVSIARFSFPVRVFLHFIYNYFWFTEYGLRTSWWFYDIMRVYPNPMSDHPHVYFYDNTTYVGPMMPLNVKADPAVFGCFRRLNNFVYRTTRESVAVIRRKMSFVPEALAVYRNDFDLALERFYINCFATFELGIANVIYIPFIEEVVKCFIDPMLFASLECFANIFRADSGSLFQVLGPWVPFMFHVYTIPYSFLNRLWMHMLWNFIWWVISTFCRDPFEVFYASTLGIFQDLVAKTSHIEEISFALDVMWKLYHKDVIGLSFSAGMRAGYLKALFTRLCISEPQDLLEIVGVGESFEAFGPREAAHSALNALSDLLPDYISKSPFTRKIAALVMLLVSIPMCSDSYFVNFLRRLVQWDSLPDGGSILDIAIGSIQAIYGAVMRLSKPGASWTDVFDLPRDVKFLTEARILLYEENSTDTRDEIMAKMKHAEFLIESRKFLYSDSIISRKIDELGNYIKERRMWLKNNVARLQPMPVVLIGDPGAGKTVINTNLINVLAKLHELKRFVGDVVQYNISDKFAAEGPGNLNQDAFAVNVNDMPSSYEQYRQLDMIPLDIFLQRAIDTAKFDIKAAAVDAKGIALNKVKYLLMSSNYSEFVGCEPAGKLERRLATGLCARVFFEDDSGRSLKYAEVKHLPQGIRNKYTRFMIGSFYTQHTRFGWLFSGEKMGVAQFVRLLIERSNAHFAAVARDNTIFEAAENTCGCGLSHMLHVANNGSHDYREIVRPGICDSIEWTQHYVASLRRLDVKYFPSGENVNPPESYVPELRVKKKDKAFGWDLDYDVPNNPVVAYGSEITHVVGCMALALLLIALFPWFLRHLKRKFLEKFGEQINYYLDSAITSPFFVPFVMDIRLRRRILHSTDREEAERALAMMQTFSKIRLFYYKHKEALHLTLGVIGAYGMYKFYNKTQPKAEAFGKPLYPHNTDLSEFSLAIPEEKQNWTPEQMRSWSKADVKSQFLKLEKTGMGFEDIQKIAKRNTVEGELKSPEGGIDCRFVYFGPDWIGFNKHYLYTRIDSNPDIPYWNQANWKKVSFPIQIVINNLERSYREDDVYSIDDSEIVLVRNLFDKAVYPLYTLLPDEVDDISFTVFNTLTNKSAICKQSSYHLPMFPSHRFRSVMWPETSKRGDCGTIILGNVPKGWFVAGILAAGRPEVDILGRVTNYTHGSLFTRSMYESLSMKFPFPDVAYHEFSGEMGRLEFGPLVHNSDLRNISYPLIRPIGTLKESNASFHTKIKKTRLYDLVSPKLSEPYGAPGKLKGVNDEGEYRSAFMNFFRNVKHFRLPWGLAIDCMRAYLDDACPPGFIKQRNIKLRPATKVEAFFGDPNINLDRIDFKTSVGRRWRKLGIKDKFLLFDCIDKEKDLWKVKKTFIDACEELLAFLDKGVCPALQVDFSPKDEVRKLRKILEYFIRLFGVVGFDFNYIMRIFLMPLIMFLMSYPEFSECYGGMNAGSKQWTMLAERLRKHPFFIDMDFSGFDASHETVMIDLLAMFFYLMSMRMGYDPVDQKRVYYLCKMLNVQLVIFMCDLFEKELGLPSGIIITLIFNSIVNSILMRIAFVFLCGKSAWDFRKYVEPATTGDDNISSISEEIIDQYNMVTIAPVYALCGYTVTPADKEKGIRAHIPWEEATFLKRKFVYDFELGLYLAPIELDSIYKSFCFQMSDAEVSADVRLKDVALSAQREAFMHGKAFFHQMQEDIISWFKATDLLHVLVLLNYDDIKEEFITGTFRTYMCSRDWTQFGNVREYGTSE